MLVGAFRYDRECFKMRPLPDCSLGVPFGGQYDVDHW
jgi:hypothetical protein